MEIESVQNLDNKEFLASLEHLISTTDKTLYEYRELKELFSGVLEAIPTALWVLDGDKSPIYFNQKAVDSGIDATQITADQDDTEIEINGRFFLLQVSSRQDKTIIVATDNTKSRRNERLIAMGQMAAHLAHEIRNPIASVAIYASTLFGKVDIRSKSIVLEIKKAIWRVERIVKATLLFSKGFTLNPTRFALSELKDELNSAIGNYSYSKDIEFDFKLDSTTIEADFDLLVMVLQNMIFNAIDAIEDDENEDGKVAIICDKKDGCFLFEISDSGSDFENKEQLFEAFYTNKTKGHGLGLILSKQIIEAHRGKISILEEKKGFLIRLQEIDF